MSLVTKYPTLSTYCNLIPSPLGTTENFADFSSRMASGFVFLNEDKAQIRFHNGKFLETMAVSTFEGSFEEIAKAAQESTSGLFKVAKVDQLNNAKISKLLESSVDLVCLSDEVILQHGMNCIPATAKYLHDVRLAEQVKPVVAETLPAQE